MRKYIFLFLGLIFGLIGYFLGPNSDFRWLKPVFYLLAASLFIIQAVKSQ